MFSIKINRKILLTILFTIIIAYSVMPIVPRIISTYVSTYAYMLILGATFVLVVTKDGFRSINYYFSFLFPYIMWKLLTYINRTDSIVMWGYSILLEMTPIVMGLFLIKENKTLPKWFLYVTMFSFAITSITTVIGLIKYPGASRWLATADTSQNPYLITYDWNNIGGYNFTYMLLLLYPLIIFAYRKRKINKLVMLIIATFLGYYFFNAAYAIALILYVITSSLLFFEKDLTVKDLIVVFIILIVLYILFSTVISGILLRLSNLTTNGNLRERLVSLAGGYQGLENSESRRLDLYRKSISTFINNPIIGTCFSGGYGIGGHSFILDYMATYGCVGLFVLIRFYKYIYRIFYKPYKNNNGYGFVVYSFFQVIILSLINTGSWLNILCLFIPLLMKHINSDESTINL